MSESEHPSPRAATLRIVGTTVAATLVSVLLVVELVMVAQRRARQAPGQSAGASSSADAAASAPQATSPPLAPPVRAALDSANGLYRAGQYAGALAQYRAAAAGAPGDAAPYFGIYMAATALHQKALADSALAIINERAGPGNRMLTDSSLQAVHGGAAAPAKP